MKITKKMLKNKHEIVTKLFLEKKKYKKNTEEINRSVYLKKINKNFKKYRKKY